MQSDPILHLLMATFGPGRPYPPLNMPCARQDCGMCAAGRIREQQLRENDLRVEPRLTITEAGEIVRT